MYFMRKVKLSFRKDIDLIAAHGTELKTLLGFTCNIFGIKIEFNHLPASKRTHLELRLYKKDFQAILVEYVCRMRIFH